ncbi:hypothetical protein BGZ89_006227 [Linnemannia elongata]|nr:hypothetical protein BGZ89_006227 [Linnemannia elongata]
MVLDINSILSHCTLLEVLHVEAVGYNNVIQIPGLWRPITTTTDKDASPAHCTPGTLRSFVLGRAIFEQSNLEDMLEHTPHLEVLHLIHLIKGDDQYDEAGLATCDYDWRRLVRLLTTLPLSSTLRSFHFSLLKDTATAGETAEMYAALIDDLPNLIDWTVSGNDLVTSAPLILNRNLHSHLDVISSLKIHWTSSREPYSDGVHPSLQPPPSSIRADKTNWWATIKVVHQYLCRSPNVQEFKLMNGYYLLIHMDIYDRRKYNYSDQSAFRWDKIAGVNIDLVPGNLIWACRNLQSLDLDLRCFKTGEVMYDVQLRVLNGYVARVCPRLRHLSIHIPPPCTEGGIPQRSALQLRLESGLCLLARLECLERLHYNLNTSECDLWDLNWMIPSGQSEKFKAKRWEKMARWCTWREEEKRLETGRDHRLDQRDTGKGLSTVQEQLKNLGLILDVMEMVKEMDREGFRCLPVLSRLCIGSEFEQTPAEEIRRIFAPNNHKDGRPGRNPQKKILESGESRLSKITGTTGTNAQVAPSPAVIQAREQLLKKEQEEERLKAMKAAVEVGTVPTIISAGDTDESSEPAKNLSAPTSPRISRQPSVSSTTAPAPTASSTTGSGAQTATTAKATPTVEDANDADPDDSLGAPPTHTANASTSSPFATMGAGGQPNPFMMNDPFFSSPQQQQALTRMMMQEEAGSNNVAARQQQAGFGAGGAPPGFTVITPQVDLTARWWKLLHFVLSVLFGVGVVYAEYRRQGDLGRFDALATDKPMPYGVYQVAPMPVFWYFVTMELILQSTRMVLHGVTASPSSTLGTIAGFLPPPFSDMIRIFMRYRLIWSSMVNDLSVIVFIIGVTIMFTHMFS